MPGLVGSQAEQIKTGDQLIISSPSLLVSLTQLGLNFPYFGLDQVLAMEPQRFIFFNLPWLPGFLHWGMRWAAPPTCQSHGGQISGARLTLPKGRRPFPAILNAFLGKSDSAP